MNTRPSGEANTVSAPRPRPIDVDLSGQVAVVTGGSRGIGRAIAIAFAESGARVVVASRKVDACEEVANSIAERTGVQARGIACHVGKWADCDNLVEEVYDSFGRCDILVNNAGMSPLYDNLIDVTEEYYDKVAAVNLKGPFRLAVLFGTRMVAEQGGSIINVSSLAASRPSRGDCVYACAKAGLNALTVSLADAFGPHVRCNCLVPGAVLTDVTRAWSPEMLEAGSAAAPLGRIGRPEDYVGPALWLAGSGSGYVTGAFIRVDGGMGMSVP